MSEPIYLESPEEFYAWLALCFGWIDGRANSIDEERCGASRCVMSAKREETRERRLDQLVEDSANGVDVKPLRR